MIIMLKEKILKYKYLFIILALLISVFIRIPFFPDNIKFNNDAELYSENIEKSFFDGTYDVQVPGYVSYIYFGRIINYFINDPLRTQHLINIILIFFITLFFYKLLIFLEFKKYEAFIYTIIFSFNNIIFIGSLTGGNRLFLVICSVILIFISLKIINSDKKEFILLFSFFFAFFIGFRQDISVYFLPLYIYLFYKIKDFKFIIYSILIFTIVCLSWFIPLIFEYGGLKSYIFKILNQKAVYNTSIILSKSKLSAIINMIRVFIYMLNAYLFIFPIFIFTIIKKKFNISRELIIVLILSFIPAFIFQILVHNGNYVHLAAFMVPLFVFLVINFRLSNAKRIIFSISIIAFLLFQFFGIRMFRDENVYKKTANVLWLQYSYDGIKKGKTYRLYDIKDEMDN